MKKLILITCFLIINLGHAQDGKTNPSTIFSFKSLTLGMSLEEFKSATPLTSPEMVKYTAPSIDCITSIKEPISSFNSLLAYKINETIKSVGGESCVYNDSVLFFKMLSINYGIYFIKKPKDENLKLFNMWFDISIADYKELLFELTKKYGKPKTHYVTLSNAFNAKFQNEVSVWENGKNKITLQKYASKTDISKLEYSLKEHERHFNKLVKELKNKAPSKI